MQTLGTSMLKGEIKESKPSQESPRRGRENKGKYQPREPQRRLCRGHGEIPFTAAEPLSEREV